MAAISREGRNICSNACVRLHRRQCSSTYQKHWLLQKRVCPREAAQLRNDHNSRQPSDGLPGQARIKRVRCRRLGRDVPVAKADVCFASMAKVDGCGIDFVVEV